VLVHPGVFGPLGFTMKTTDSPPRTTNRTRRLVAACIVAFLLLLGAAGWRSLSQAESIGHDFVTRTYADTLTLSDVRSSVGQLSRAERDLLIAPGNAAQLALLRAEWDRALAQARAKARQLVASRPSERAAIAIHVDTLLAAYADAAGPVLRQAELGGISTPASDKALGPARKLVQAAETELAALSGQLERAAAGSDLARQQALQYGRWWLACTVLCAAAIVVALTLPGPVRAALGIADPAPGRGPDGRRTPPDDVPTLQPEVVTPDYAGIDRRGPDRPRNIVRAEFNPKAAPASRKTGHDGAGETT
jgi:hypothetical protein